MCSSRRSVVGRWCVVVVAFLYVATVVHRISAIEIVISEPSTTSRLIQHPNNGSLAVSTNQCSHASHGSLLLGVFSEIQQSIGHDDGDCGHDVQVIQQGIHNRNSWALKILDTGPHVPSSFVFGNNFWFSASDLCHYVNAAPRLTLTEHMPKRMRADLLRSVAPVRMRHRMLYANCSTGMQMDSNFPLLPIVHIGLCMPASCSDEQVVRHTQSYLSRRTLPIQSAFDMEMNVIAVKDMYRDPKRITQTASFQLMVITFGFAAVVLVANIIYALFKSSKCDKPSATEESVLQRIAKCFNIGDSVYELFHHQHPERDVAAVAAFRAIVCIWVLTFHVNYHSAFTLSNLAQVIIKMEWFGTQPIFQAFLYVDVFFVISSILMVYNFLKNDSKRLTVQQNNILQNVVFLGRHILHRYVRLTPVMVMTIIFSDVIYNYLDEYSPYMMNDRSDLYCKETWWYNIVYAQNMLPLDNMCGSWTWYLACDMQYYIVGMLVLFVYAKMPNYAKSLYIWMSVSVVLLSYHLTSVQQLTYKIDIVMANLNMLYAHPVVRISPFLGGAFCGWLLYKTRYARFRPGAVWVALYWTFVAVFFVASIFYTYNRDIKPGHVAMLWSIGKFVFGLYIGSIVLMCHWGNGGLLTQLFAHPLFQHLSKLTYSVYMISPLVITILHGGKEVSTHFDEMQTVINVVATCVVSYAVAVLLAVFYEVPFQKLSDEFVMKRTRRANAT